MQYVKQEYGFDKHRHAAKKEYYYKRKKSILGALFDFKITTVRYKIEFNIPFETAT